MSKGNRPATFQSHQFNIDKSTNLKMDSDFDQSQKNQSLYPSIDNNINSLSKKIFPPSVPDTNNHLNLQDNNTNNNNLRNAYTIIYDQANSIQILQEKVRKLQSELERVVSKLKNQPEENSLNCSSGIRKSLEKNKQLISTGINTSIDFIQNLNMENSAIQFNKSNENVTNLISKNDNKEAEYSGLNYNKIKSDEDIRYANLLNDNSINFPKQFLDMDSKQYDSHREETNNINHINQNNNNININSNGKEFSNYNDINTNTNLNNQLYDNFTFKSYKNFNQQINPSNLLDNYLNTKNISNTNLIKNNNNTNNLTNLANDLTKNDNLNLICYNHPNINNNNFISNDVKSNKNKDNKNYQHNIYYSSDFTIHNNELKKEGDHNDDLKDNEEKAHIRNISKNQSINKPININPNYNNFKKDNSIKKHQNQNNIFSTIQTSGIRDDDEYNNYPFNPNKYQTIDNSSKLVKDNISNKRRDSANVLNNYDLTNNNINNINNINFEKNVNSEDKKFLEVKINKNDQYIDYNKTSINNDFNGNNNNYNNLFANSFITNLEKLNDSSYICNNDSENKMNYDYNYDNNVYREKNINNEKEDKSKIDIPKTCSINNNLEITANDNTSINYDISHSIDPGTYRMFLKAPSMLYKTNNSILKEVNENGKLNKIRTV